MFVDQTQLVVGTGVINGHIKIKLNQYCYINLENFEGEILKEKIYTVYDIHFPLQPGFVIVIVGPAFLGLSL